MKKIIIFLLISSLLLAKDINVGDLVRVHISGVEKDKIINEFKNSDLQLENLEKTDEGYILSIRGYKPGDSSITLGDKKLTLSIKSVLDEKDNEIYPHLTDNGDTLLYSQNFPYQIVVGAILGILSLIYLIKTFKFRKKEKILSPEEKFKKILTELSENDWEFQLSMAIREYIDKKYQTHFINGKYEVIGMINSEDIKFINNLDRNKFSKENQLLKDETLKKVIEIYEKIRGDQNV
ncbi:hypothetical protein [uncultured Fusobacterium sp.]|jgi:hypothetical protein|uniref:hypothetical protein n=1 Tax=Fusobacterium sp. HC1336 TaxID=3171169 RepID=UPI0025E4E789|nr:hypothetical protein [uncultured Fusobacterium sp.]